MTTVADLKQMCKENGIKGYSKFRKHELVKICSGISTRMLEERFAARTKRRSPSPKRRSPKRSIRRLDYKPSRKRNYNEQLFRANMGYN